MRVGPQRKLRAEQLLELRAEQFQIVVLEKTLESPLDSKEIKLFNPNGNQP